MAYLVQRSPRRVEIRESRSTARGPRAFLLASFSGALTRDVLDRAAARAARPFDPRALLRRARVLGIPVVEAGREPEARALLARLRRGPALDPTLAAALRQALDRLPETPPPEALAEVSEWVGASPAERGRALRELLDLYGTIAASRGPRRRAARRRFPRFRSRDAAA